MATTTQRPLSLSVSVKAGECPRPRYLFVLNNKPKFRAAKTSDGVSFYDIEDTQAAPPDRIMAKRIEYRFAVRIVAALNGKPQS